MRKDEDFLWEDRDEKEEVFNKLGNGFSYKGKMGLHYKYCG